MSAAVLIVTSAHLGARSDNFIGLLAHGFIFPVRLSVFISLKTVDAACGKWNEYSARQILRFVCSVLTEAAEWEWQRDAIRLLGSARSSGVRRVQPDTALWRK
ncbi:hypothetical protein [Rhizobium mongolense]|uniref:hypothetical protein n=1 Tax=Rhizobium mongolense TaxID=57676 RepID=UPI00111420D4|nr:hypothetical protein [Rhizobium mongolense]